MSGIIYQKQKKTITKAKTRKYNIKQKQNNEKIGASSKKYRESREEKERERERKENKFIYNLRKYQYFIIILL